MAHPLGSFTASQIQLGLHRVSLGLRHHAVAIPKIKVDFSKVPDWQRRATRLGIALVFFGMLGHCVEFPPEYAAVASSFRQSCNWAAITCIVVTAPLIGKVAQVAFDRLLGTTVGGFIGCVCFTVGFHLFGTLGGGVFISLMSVPTVWATTYLAFRHSLDQLARFVQLTYCIVAFGARPDKGALVVALLRVGGIFAGGLFGVVLAVLVLPRSASVDSLLEMKRALRALHELNTQVWLLSGATASGGHTQQQGLSRRLSRKAHRHGYSALQLRMDAAARAEAGDEAGSTSTAPNGGGFGAAAAAAAGVHPSSSDPALGGGGGGDGAASSWPDGLRRVAKSASGKHPSVNDLSLLVQHDEERDSREAAIEKLFTAVYTALGRVEENLAQTKGEIYIWHFWGRYFFLPGVHWFPVRGRWSVPRKDLEDMATCMRRVARMLWTLLLDFEEGFGSEMESVLRLYYPKQLLSELADYQSRAILDLLRAFPGATSIEVDNLFTLGQVTDCLLQISDARARNMVFRVKRRRAAAAAAAAATGSNPGSATSSASKAAAPAAEIRGSADWQRLSFDQSTRPAVSPGGGDGSITPAAPTAVTATAATAAAMDVEKQPLLAPATLNSSLAANDASCRGGGSVCGGAGGGGGGPSASPLLLLPRNGSGANVQGGGPSRLGLLAGAGGGRGGGGGVFTSRLLSGTPGETVALHLPPRRYLQEQMQQQQQCAQQSPSPADGSHSGGKGERPPLPTAAVTVTGAALLPPSGLSASIDIFDGVQFDALVTERPAAAAEATAGAGADVSAAAAEAAEAPTAAPQQPTVTSPTESVGRPPRPRGSPGRRGADAAAPAALQMPHSALPPSDKELPQEQQQPLAAPPAAMLAGAAAAPAAAVTAPMAAATAAAAGRRATPFARSSPIPGWLEAFTLRPSEEPGSPAAAAAAAANKPGPASVPLSNNGGAAAAAAAAGVRGSPDRGPLGSSGFGAATAAVVAALAVSDRSRGRGRGLDGGGGSALLSPALQRLDSPGVSSSAVMVEPVTFPPTEEGYLAQVRWYSFQFVMDELVNELEEAFHACSAVLQKLPYPIGN